MDQTNNELQGHRADVEREIRGRILDLRHMAGSGTSWPEWVVQAEGQVGIRAERIHQAIATRELRHIGQEGAPHQVESREVAEWALAWWAETYRILFPELSTP